MKTGADFVAEVTRAEYIKYLEQENQQLKDSLAFEKHLHSFDIENMGNELLALKELVKEAQVLLEDSTFDYDAGFNCFNGWAEKARQAAGEE
jgi:hypothetical protein